MSSTPETVEPGQVWRDNDERSKGAGEFEVIHVFTRYRGSKPGVLYATVYRSASQRRADIRVDRLLKGGNTQRGYTYIGRAR